MRERDASTTDDTDADAPPYDLAICPVVMEGPSGAKLYRMVVASRPEAAARIVLVTDRVALDAAPPSTARARVLARPVDPAEVAALLERR
jgi:hypothetical protein